MKAELKDNCPDFCIYRNHHFLMGIALFIMGCSFIVGNEKFPYAYIFGFALIAIIIFNFGKKFFYWSKEKRPILRLSNNGFEYVAETISRYNWDQVKNISIIASGSYGRFFPRANMVIQLQDKVIAIDLLNECSLSPQKIVEMVQEFYPVTIHNKEYFKSVQLFYSVSLVLLYLFILAGLLFFVVNILRMF